MPSFAVTPSVHLLGVGLVLLLLIVRPARAFGAGNIASVSKIEGQNWRHGDIEDTLLTLLMSRAAGGKKFGKLDVKRVYFGNWLRDYSQAVDVGTVKMVSAEAIRILLWILGFLSFGYGTKEFEVTTERLGCYRPEEHIDNPKDYADNIDARRYDRRLRGPVDERRELSVDPETGLKNYIASERLGITTSAGMVRQVFGRSIQLGRQFARSGNQSDLFEALRLLGTACHCLEDFSAHSNYTELALIELGERGVFPHVGRQTRIDLPGARQPVYPLVTGTFGGVDFLHSVMGEVSDKATQSEIQELEGTIQQAQKGQGNPSVLQDLLDQLPDGLLGGGNQKDKMNELQRNRDAAQMENMHISPREPEEWAQQLQQITKQIYPVMEWHDDLMKSINETIENIPVLPDLIENFQEQINIFVFSAIAPYVLPIIKQVKAELSTGSSEVIQSSREKQLIVFRDDYSSDPTHSMLSKDHFSNVLNEPAGRVASQVLKWVVPQIIACWDDERIDVDRTLTRIIQGVFHHPALRHQGQDGAVDGRRQMFEVVKQWWESKTEAEQRVLRDQLRREGVEAGRNHKEGVHDSGHGCGKPLGMPTYRTAGSSGAVGGSAFRPGVGGRRRTPVGDTTVDAAIDVGKKAGQAVGGGAIGGIVGGLVGGVGASLLGGGFDGDDVQKKKYSKQQTGDDGSYVKSYIETARREERSAQAELRQTTYPDGRQRQEYQRYEQPSSRYGGDGHGYREVRETRPLREGGYEAVTESRYERPGGAWESDTRRETRGQDGRYNVETSHDSSYGTRDDHERRGKKSDSDDDDYKKKYKKEKEYRKKEEKREKKERKKKLKDRDSDDTEDDDDDDDKDRRDRSRKHGDVSQRYEGEGGGYSRRRDDDEERSGYGQTRRSDREPDYDARRAPRSGDDDYRGSSYGQESSRSRHGDAYGDAYGGRGLTPERSYQEGRGDYGRRTDYDERPAAYPRQESYGGHGGSEEAGYGYGAGDRDEETTTRYTYRREVVHDERDDDRYQRGGSGSRGYGDGDDYRERRGYGEDY